MFLPCLSPLRKRTLPISCAMSVRSVDSSNARLKYSALSKSFSTCNKSLSVIISTLLLTVESDNCSFEICLMLSLFLNFENSDAAQSTDVFLRYSPSIANFLAVAMFQAVLNETSVMLSLFCWVWKPGTRGTYSKCVPGPRTAAEEPGCLRWKVRIPCLHCVVLGIHHIQRRGGEAELSASQDWPQPENRKQLQQFFSFANFY